MAFDSEIPGAPILEPVVAPIAKKVPTRRTNHGDTVVDDYEWLRAKDDPEVIAYLEAENAYAEAQTANLATLRENIFDEIKARTKETDLSVPVRMGEYWYYSRSFEGKQYGVHCRCPIENPDDWTPPELDETAEIPGEHVLLDSNELAEGLDFFAIGAFSISPDGNLLAYSVDTVGDERYVMRFKDLRTGQSLGDEIAGTAPGATWSVNGTHVFYLTVDESWRPDTVWRHRLGTSTDTDVKVFHEPDERYWVGIGSTRSEKYLMIWVGSKITSEGWLLESADPEGEFRLILPRKEGVEYSAEHAVIAGEDRFLILHNDIVDGVKAENFVLAEAPVDNPADMRILIGHRDDVRLEEVDTFADHLVLGYRREALPRVAILPLTDKGYGQLRELEFGLELFAAGLGANPEWHQPVLRIGLTSFITPSQVFDYVPKTGEFLLRKQQPVLGGFDPDDYEQHRLWATATDGTRIPISLVQRKDEDSGAVTDGYSAGSAPKPLLLYGYGSYESSIDPSFSVSRLSLLDRGMVFAIAHVRGGGEMGRGWYEDGKILRKKNTFTDFIDCARHLVEVGITGPDRMVADGGSAGGLLVGAVANMAPELFAGIMANVPFVDPLTSILDPSLPLTVIEWDEWGNPLADKEVYDYIKSYSPYENITVQDYPAIMAITSLNDTRVLYVEPAKWVAKLRATKTGHAPLLLKTEMSAGHGGVSGRYEKWREVAYEYAWLIHTAGLPAE